MPKPTNKGLHTRNQHSDRYDFPALIKSEPALAPFVSENKYGDLSIDFADAQAVLALNKALLSHFYGIKKWSIPADYLCPPIPGRADYIHYIADLLARSNDGTIPLTKSVIGLDIGTGANCIYPIIGSFLYGWDFVAADVDTRSLSSAQTIVDDNPTLVGKIECRLQKNSDNIFKSIITKEDRFDFTVCNPPFHVSKEAAHEGSQRKVRNLTKNRKSKTTLNFGGQANELWYPGGEVAFIKTMISESKSFATQCLWFTSLVSKKEHLQELYKALEAIEALEFLTIPMQQGQKATRIVAWSFQTKAMQKQWYCK